MELRDEAGAKRRCDSDLLPRLRAPGAGTSTSSVRTEIGLSRNTKTSIAMSFDLVLFGGTGDLAWRKLMPALFQAFRHGTLPKDGRIIGVARDNLFDSQYRELIRSRFNDVDLAKRPSAEEFDRFAQLLHFVRVDLS